jgi:hypothetical protein
MRWAGHVVGVEEEENTYRVSVGKPARKRRLGSTRWRLHNNVKKELREI